MASASTTKNIIFMGPTAAGKSQIIKSIVQDTSIEVSFNAGGTTSYIEGHNYQYSKEQAFVLVDTIGLESALDNREDPRYKANAKRSLDETIKNLGRVHLFVIVGSLELNPIDTAQISRMVDIIKNTTASQWSGHFMFVFTRVDTHEGQRADYRAHMNRTYYGKPYEFIDATGKTDNRRSLGTFITEMIRNATLPDATTQVIQEPDVTTQVIQGPAATTQVIQGDKGCCIASNHTIFIKGRYGSVLADANPGDKVLTHSGFSTFLGWFHPTKNSRTAVLHVKSTGHLELTYGHLICTTRGFLPVQYVVIGDELVTYTGSTMTILNITKSFSNVAAPLTTSGTIIVNNFVVSCYALVYSHSIANVVFLPVRLGIVKDITLYKDLCIAMYSMLPHCIKSYIAFI